MKCLSCRGGVRRDQGRAGRGLGRWSEGQGAIGGDGGLRREELGMIVRHRAE